MLKHAERLEGIHPLLKKVIIDAAEICPVDISVIEGLRTMERQEQLLKEGKTKLRNSYHLTGHAVDVFDGKSWEKAAFAPIIKAIEEAAKASGVTITGGYEWGWDYPHWQIERSGRTGVI